MNDSASAMRAKMALAAAAILCAWGALEAISWEKTYQAQNRDPYMLGMQDLRLAPMRDAVPQDAIMGYVTDLTPGTTADSAAFATSQYALAPRILRRGVDAKWVLGMLSKPDDELTLAREHSLTVAIGVQNGAVLFRNDGVK